MTVILPVFEFLLEKHTGKTDMTNLLFALLFCDFSFQTHQRHIYSLNVLRLTLWPWSWTFTV